MSDPRPKELIQTEELRFIGKVEESLEIIRNYERKHGITPEEQLWTLLLKGWGYGVFHHTFSILARFELFPQ